MKKLLKIAAAALLSLVITGCSGTKNQPLEVDYTPQAGQNCVTPPFWVVEDADTGAQIFLLGSMHAGVKDAQYPDYILDAMRNSSWVAPEMDTVAFSNDFILRQKCVKYLLLDGVTARDVIGADYDSIAVYFRSRGIWQDGMESLCPFMWASAASPLVMDQAGLDAEYGTENVLLELAHKEGMKIREIEGGEAQYKMMGSIPMSVQLETLEQCTSDESIKRQAQESTELYEAWSSFDDGYFSELEVYDPSQVSDQESWQTYYDMMYTDRQKLMADFIIDALQKGELGFVFVGTMHYYAEPSVISQLEQAGYTVRAIRGTEAAELAAA